MAKLRVRIDLEPAGAIGPGKVRLLESVEALGSISAAARSMKMSYRRAWLLIDSLNRSFREPVVKSCSRVPIAMITPRFVAELAS